MAPRTDSWGYKTGRGISSLCTQFATVVGFSLMLTYVFILYQPSWGPGIQQKMGWQSWEVIRLATPAENNTAGTSTPQTGSSHNSTTGVPDKSVDWWNVTSPEDQVDSSSFPLDIWSPLLPHDTGLSEITVAQCHVDPDLLDDFCAPSSDTETDALQGTWVRIPRNLNLEGGRMSGWLNVYYRRTRRQDVKLVNDLRILDAKQQPEGPGWTRVKTSLRDGIRGVPDIYLWYRAEKTAGEMTQEERSKIITELDVLYGEDIPWYGFEKLEPPTLPRIGNVEPTWITFRRGVKKVPKAPTLHFSHSGKFKVLQVADLHFSVAAGQCLEATLPGCDRSDNLTSTLIAHVLDEEKPDMVVFTGDQMNGQGTSWDAKSVLAKFSRAAAERGIPWAAVFGNHDEDDGFAKDQQVALMKGLPYSMVERGPKDVHGVGNYVLKVYSPDPSKTHTFTFYFLDSGSYSKGFFDWFGFFKPTEYDYIRQSQINWFLQESASISPIMRPFVPDTGKDIGHAWARQSDQITPQVLKLAKPNALMFYHIPIPETYNAADKDPLTGRPLDVGITGQEPQGAPKTNEGFFEKGILKALESERRSRDNAPEVKAIGNGHCHLTENCRRVKGVWFCFGGGGSYSGYGKLGFDRRFRVYDISDFGETIRTYKRTEKDEIVDEMILAGRGAPDLS